MGRRLRIAAFVALVPIVMALFGCCLDGPEYRGPVSDHFDGKRFHNEVDDRPGAGGLVKWMLHRKHGVWHDHSHDLPGPPPPPLVADSAMRVTFVNHATVLLQADGINLLTDPIWSERAGPEPWAGEKRKRAPGIRFEDLPKIDVVILSHNHYDHLDLPTLLRLAKRDSPRVFCGLGNAAFLRARGVDATELDWWQSVELKAGVVLTSVPAKHFSGRGAFDMARTLWTGWVLEGPAGRAYFAGDTGYGAHFAKIAARFPGLRLAMLPIGSYEPRWFMKPVHMNPADAVAALRDLGAAQAVAIHFGTFDQTDEGEDDPARALALALTSAGIPSGKFRVLGFGEGFDVPDATRQ